MQQVCKIAIVSQGNGVWGCGLESSGSVKGLAESSRDRNNEPSCSIIIGRELYKQPREYQFLMKNFLLQSQSQITADKIEWK